MQANGDAGVASGGHAHAAPAVANGMADADGTSASAPLLPSSPDRPTRRLHVRCPFEMLGALKAQQRLSALCAVQTGLPGDAWGLPEHWHSLCLDSKLHCVCAECSDPIFILTKVGSSRCPTIWDSLRGEAAVPQEAKG